MTILVTGATGNLGRLVVESLLERVPVAEVVVAVRDLDKAADIATRGVQVRQADYTRPETLKSAFVGVDKLLLISGSDLGDRVAQHQAVIDAATEANVGFLAYTSVLGGEKATFTLAADHHATETALRASDLPFALLRNGWYTENYTAQLDVYLKDGLIIGSRGRGLLASASLRDFADAAAAVLTTDGHVGAVYELSGDEAWSYPQFAAEVAAQAGRPVVYRDISHDEHVRLMLDAGLPELWAKTLADVESGIARGELAHTTGDLARLIGRPTTPMSDSIRIAITGS